MKPLAAFTSASEITLVFATRTLTIDRSHHKWEEINEAVKAKDYEKVEALYDTRKQVITHFEGTGVVLTDDVVTYKGGPVPPIMAQRILQAYREGGEPMAIARFLDNVMKNPTYSAVQELWLFLEHNKIPITEDGCFLVWKKVRENYMDIHSNSVRYMVGDKPEMLRNLVDDDRNVLCSKGYHVCGWSYLAHFASSNPATDRVMVCKVNPAHVVAVPRDYANAKMRVEKLEVVAEHTESYNDYRKTFESAVTPAFSAVDDTEDEFSCGTDDEDEDGCASEEEEAELKENWQYDVTNGYTDLGFEDWKEAKDNQDS